MQYWQQLNGDSAFQLYLAAIQIAAAAIIPVIGWAIAKRALTRVRCYARCEKFDSVYGAKFWSFRVESKREYCSNVNILISFRSPSNYIERIFLKGSFSGVELKRIGENVLLHCEILPRNEIIEFALKAGVDDVPKIVGVGKEFFLIERIDSGFPIDPKYILRVYQNLMILMLLFMSYFALLGIRLLYLAWAS